MWQFIAGRIRVDSTVSYVTWSTGNPIISARMLNILSYRPAVVVAVFTGYRYRERSIVSWWQYTTLTELSQLASRVHVECLKKERRVINFYGSSEDKPFFLQ